MCVLINFRERKGGCVCVCVCVCVCTYQFQRKEGRVCVCVCVLSNFRERKGGCVCVCVCVAHSTGYLTLEVRRGPKQGCMARLTGMASLLDSAGRQVRAGPGHRIGPGRLGHGKTCSQAGAVRPSEAPCSSLLALPAT